MNRPLVEVSISIIIGIIGGMMWIDNLLSPLFLMCLCLVGVILFIIKKENYKSLMSGTIVLIIGVMMILNHSIVREKSYFDTHDELELIGRIIEKKENNYSIQMIVDQVEIKKQDKVLKLSSKVMILVEEDKQGNREGAWIRCKGKVLSDPMLMNPSDMDYLNYLRGKGVVRRVKAQEIRRIGYERLVLNEWGEQVSEQIQSIFKGKDKGVVTTLLTGRDEALLKEVKALYFELGIGHLLALSGFHLGLIGGLILFVCKTIGVSYKDRYIITFFGIWGYTLITGGATSTLRAAIMLSVVFIGRYLWEEEDSLTSLALAAILILMNNPFTVSQVGFQLSFTAVVGIIVSNWVIEELDEQKAWTKLQRKRWTTLLIPVGIFLSIGPVLAYHFFEIPFLIQSINLIMIPLFTILIPYTLVCLMVSYVYLPLAVALGKVVIIILEGVEQIGVVLIKMPFAHLITGRPNMIVIIAYYVGLGCFVGGITRRISITKARRGILLIVGIVLISVGYKGRWLELTQLYVGQGDSTVIITPRRQSILIDGGPTGKGQVIENYLKYKGIAELDAVVVSHSHEDHLGGVIELIEKGYEIKNIFIPSEKSEEHLIEKLYSLCREYNIPLYEWSEGGIIKVGRVELECLWPQGKIEIEDINENSLVIKLQYGEFNALYTGDIGKETEKLMYERLQDIDLLKVAHHGSKNSTSEQFLLQTRPEYAIISCGMNNVYSHPHQDTLNLLEQYPIRIWRTDLKGAVTLYVNRQGQVKRTVSQVGGLKD